MGRYLEREMQGNEKIVYASQLHWIVYHFGLSTTIIGALFGHYSPVLARLALPERWAELVIRPMNYVGVAIIVFGAMHLFYGFIRQISTELVITNRRVIAKYGFIATTTYELMLSKVEGANIDQTILGRLLGYGTVMVKGTGGGISPIDHVADPYRFHAYLMKTLETFHNPAPPDKEEASGAND